VFYKLLLLLLLLLLTYELFVGFYLKREGFFVVLNDNLLNYKNVKFVYSLSNIDVCSNIYI